MKRVLGILVVIIGFGATARAQGVVGTYQFIPSDRAVTAETYVLRHYGAISARIGASKICHGSYRIRPEGYLEIKLDGVNGPATGGGCHNFSSIIDIGETDLQALPPGERAIAISRSSYRFNAPKNGIIRRIK